MAIKRRVGNTSSQRVIHSSNSMTHQPTALIFDSGVGGLSVYQEIRRWSPDLHFIYAFDNAFFPYGEKEEHLIVERVVKIVDLIQEKHPLDIVVIACNTASTVSLPALRERFNFPVVGVVPAIKPAAQQTHNGVIGLLATNATVNRTYTHDLIDHFAAECSVQLLGSSRLVEIAEGKLHGDAVDKEELKAILAPWTEMETPPDTIVLGCTHFPLLRDELSSVLPPNTVLVDSGDAVARRVASLLGQSSWDEREKINQAYCTKLDKDAGDLLPALVDNGFDSLQTLTV